MQHDSQPGETTPEPHPGGTADDEPIFDVMHTAWATALSSYTPGERAPYYQAAATFLDTPGVISDRLQTELYRFLGVLNFIGRDDAG